MVAGRLPERVEGERLILRRWTSGDVDLLSDTVKRNLEHLRPWMPWVADEPLSRGQRLTLVEAWERDWLDGGDVPMAVFLGEAAVGSTGLHRRRGPHGLEIGYWVDHAHLGQGIATESAAMLTDVALGLNGITFVEIHHDKANVRSARVPERLGYAFIGETTDTVEAPGEVGVDCGWRMTRKMWLPRGHLRVR